MLKRIINRYFRDYRYGGFVLACGLSTLHFNSPTFWTDLWRSLTDEITFKYNYYFKFKTSTVSLREIKGKWDHVPCKKLYTHSSAPKVRDVLPEPGYDWDALIESLSTSTTYGTLHIKKISPKSTSFPDFKAKGYTYRVINGNHRLAVLKCLYGVDHKIKIKYMEQDPVKDNVTITIANGRTDLELTPIKVKLKEVEMDYPNATLKDLQSMDYCYEHHIAPYPWKKFIKDIKTRGVQKKPIVMTKETIPIGTTFLYTIFDGNHRIKALEVLYGKEYEVDVHLFKTMTENLKYIEGVKKMKKEMAEKIITSRLQTINKKVYK